MAFTLRPTLDQENILEEICKKGNFSTKSKAITFLIESEPKTERLMFELREEINELRKELRREKMRRKEVEEKSRDFFRKQTEVDNAKFEIEMLLKGDDWYQNS